ncbi:MptD family putative ECF transporter S component [Aerococcaceae bacterium NML180378]|nr:MptD family putative ECF transporter S component [Aerococcaceae bacterium NML180378]
MKQLTIKDLMTTGVYAALYFLFVALGTLVGVVIIHSGNMMLAPAFTALFAGTVYMVLISKVQKFGAITLVGVMMACFFFFSGHFIVSFIPSLVFGVLADSIGKMGNYQSKLGNLLSYIVFSFGNLGPIILMWVAREAYVQRLLDKGKDMTYVNNVMVEFNVSNVAFLLGIVAIGALIGGLFGQYILCKHFTKAGMAGE